MDIYLRSKWENIELRSKYQFIKRPLISTQQDNAIRPFFIVGSGRSGTSLLRKMLIGNPDIVIPPESGSLLEASVKFYIRNNKMSWENMVSEILRMWSEAHEFDYWNIDANEISDRLKGTANEQQSLAAIIDGIYDLHRLKHKPSATIWGDKTPFAVFGLKWINLLFPHGVFIHMLRDGRDVVNSMIKHQLSKDVVEACQRWNDALDQIRKFTSKMEIITIRYEQLIENPENCLKLISKKLNVDYVLDQSLIDHFDFGDHHLSHHSNLREPIMNTQVGKWKKELHPDTIKQVNSLLSENLKRFSYI